MAIEIEPSDPDGSRTRVTAVKGRCPRPLDDGAMVLRIIFDSLLCDSVRASVYLSSRDVNARWEVPENGAQEFNSLRSALVHGLVRSLDRPDFAE